MKIINNISPLPFYMSLDMQHHRKDYAFGQIYPLLILGRIILPFQFILDMGSPTCFSNDFNNDFDKSGGIGPSLVTIKFVTLHQLSTGNTKDITPTMLANRLSIALIGSGLVLIKYPGIMPVSEITEEGPYYISIDTNIPGVPTIYSDVFISTNDTAKCITLEYGNTYNLVMPVGFIDFADGFRFRCYIDAEIGKPEYVFEEEATERMGYTFVESQVSKKIFKFVCLAPEYLCDALRIVRLCNYKRLDTKYNTYWPTTFNMSPQWEDQGDLASVECEFETDTVIQNIGNIK